MRGEPSHLRELHIEEVVQIAGKPFDLGQGRALQTAEANIRMTIHPPAVVTPSVFSVALAVGQAAQLCFKDSFCLLRTMLGIFEL